MAPREIKLTLPHTLAAVLWLVAWVASWLVWRLEGPNEHWLMPFALPIAFLMFGAPFLAAGTFLGRPAIGLLSAIVVFAAKMAWLMR